MNNVSFTGHRDVHGTETETLLRDAVDELINDGADMFFAGGAAGFDMLAAKTVLELRVIYPWISLVLVLPCSPEEQTRSFSASSREEYYEIYHSADRIEYVSEHYAEGCMKARNQRLIDYADVCVCWYDERRHATGTGQTVRMAQKKGITVINLFER